MYILREISDAVTVRPLSLQCFSVAEINFTLSTKAAELAELSIHYCVDVLLNAASAS